MKIGEKEEIIIRTPDGRERYCAGANRILSHREEICDSLDKIIGLFRINPNIVFRIIVERIE